MAIFKKKKEQKKVAPKATGKSASPKQLKPVVPPDIFTLFLGLSALLLVVTVVVLGLNYHGYRTTEPPVVPLNWTK